MKEENRGQILIYRTPLGATEIEVNIERDTVWLSLNQIAELFQRDKSVISKHITSIYNEGELDEIATVAKNATLQKEGNRNVTRQIEYKKW